MFQVLKRVLIGNPIATADEGHHRLRKTRRAAGLRLRRDLVDGLRHGRDPDRPARPGRRRCRGVRLARPHRHHRRHPAGHRRPVVPPDDPRLPVRWRLVHRLQGEPRRHSVTGRRGVAADRLHPDRRRLGGRRSPGDAVGVRLRAARCACPLCLGIIVVLTVANLRGVRESGALFAPPTYLYIVMLGVLIVVGLYRVFFRDLGPIPLDTLSEEARELAEGAAALSLFMLLRAFSSGAVALSGVEAVSNGVPAFRKPETTNAAKTIAIMGVVLGLGFLGVSRSGVAPPAVPWRERSHRHRPDGRVRLRRQERAVLADPDRHPADPRPRRQHCLRRLPAAVVDHRP